MHVQIRCHHSTLFRVWPRVLLKLNTFLFVPYAERRENAIHERQRTIAYFDRIRLILFFKNQKYTFAENVDETQRISFPVKCSDDIVEFRMYFFIMYRCASTNFLAWTSDPANSTQHCLPNTRILRNFSRRAPNSKTYEYYSWINITVVSETRITW